MLVPNGIYFERYIMNSGDDSDSLMEQVEIAWKEFDWDKCMVAAVPEVAMMQKIKKFIKDKCKKIFK